MNEKQYQRRLNILNNKIEECSNKTIKARKLGLSFAIASAGFMIISVISGVVGALIGGITALETAMFCLLGASIVNLAICMTEGFLFNKYKKQKQSYVQKKDNLINRYEDEKQKSQLQATQQNEQEKQETCNLQKIDKQPKTTQSKKESTEVEIERE